jgi:uncharacterized iron-regulated membrane protein
MPPQQMRNLLFKCHRYLGLILGIFVAIAGLTGSVAIVLTDTWEVRTLGQIEPVAPQPQRLSFQAIVDRTQAAYPDRKQLQVSKISPTMFPHRPQRSPSLVTFTSLEKGRSVELTVMVNPSTGKVLGEQPKQPLYDAIMALHVNLFGGDVGKTIMGIVGLLGSILTLTGIALWPGWRKLSAGFKIKWNARPKRLNFDLHKVAGLFASLFLTMALFTGFMWNLSEQTDPILYWATFSQKPVVPTSTPIIDRSSLQIDELVQKAEAAMPGGVIETIYMPTEATATFDVSKKYPGDISWGRYIMLDRYSGEVLAYENPLPSWKNAEPDPNGMEVLKAFGPVHFGSWAGSFSRLLYFCVGLMPTILLVTGFKMFGLRRWAVAISKEIVTHAQKIEGIE